jgi:tetratricopeptide (TPR) repeat protein
MWVWGFCWAQTPPTTNYSSALDDAKKLQAQGDLAGVVRTLSPWVEKDQERPEAHHLVGVAQFQQQNFAEAIRHLVIAQKLEAENSPSWKQAVEALGMAYYFSNRAQEARPLLEKAVGWNPDDTYFGYALAMAQVYARDWVAARRSFARLFDLPPESAEALALTADFLFREKFVAEAEKLIQEAQKKRADLPDLHYRQALIALTNGVLPEAVKHLQAELASNPAHPMAWYYLGYVYNRQGKTEQAIQSLQRSIWLNVRLTEAYVLIAEVYSQQGKYIDAEQALKRALELAPQNYEAHFSLARIYHKSNRPDLAKKEMTIANKLRLEIEARQ